MNSLTPLLIFPVSTVRKKCTIASLARARAPVANCANRAFNASKPGDANVPAAIVTNRSSCVDAPCTSGVIFGNTADRVCNAFVATGIVSPARLSDHA